MQTHPFFSEPRLFLHGPNQVRFVLGPKFEWSRFTKSKMYRPAPAHWLRGLLERFVETQPDAKEKLCRFYAAHKGQLVNDFWKWQASDLVSAIEAEVGDGLTGLSSGGSSFGRTQMSNQRTGSLILMMEEPPWIRFAHVIQGDKESEEKKEEPEVRETFFEVQFVDVETGEPVPDVVFEVEAGTKQQAKSDQEGVLKLEGLKTDLPEAVIYPSPEPNLTIDQCWIKGEQAKEIGTQIIHGPLKKSGVRKHWMEVDKYSVKEGDTLTSIAEKNHIDVKKLCQFNFGTTDEEEIKEALPNLMGAIEWACDKPLEHEFTGYELPGKIFIPKPFSNRKLGYGKQHCIEIGAVKRECHILKSTVPLEQDIGLANNRTMSDFIMYKCEIFKSAEGKPQIPKTAFEQYYRELKDGIFEMPPIRLKTQQIKAASFSSKTETIEISFELVCDAMGIDPNSGKRREDYESENVKILMNFASQTVLVCLLEEHGHYIDHILRNHFSEVGGDSVDDEGALSAHTLFNPKWDSQRNIQVGEYIGPDEKMQPVVIDTMKIEELIKKYLNEKAVSNDGKSQSRENFDEGRFDQQFGVEVCLGPGWTHEKIEGVLLSTQDKNSSKEPLFTLDEGKSIYFGNWLRDFSQMNKEEVFSSKSNSNGGPVPIRMLTNILTELAEFKFGRLDHKFEVTSERLGGYNWLEHIDNPYGTDAFKYIREAFGIDPNTWMYNYIGTSSSRYKSALDHIDQQIDIAFEEGRTHEGLIALGNALHALEDYFAHSNFCEVFLRSLGHEHVYCWTNEQKVRGEPEETFFPIVTGMAGLQDTFVSLSHKMPLIFDLIFKGEKEAGNEFEEWKMDAKAVTAQELAKWVLTIGLKYVEYKWDKFEDRVVEIYETIYEEIREFLNTPFSVQRFVDSVLKYPREKIEQIELAYFIFENRKTIFDLASEHLESLRRLGADILGTFLDPALQKQIDYLEDLKVKIEAFMIEAGDSVHDFQNLFREYLDFPTHTLLAKDHHSHLFHGLASRFSKIAVKHVAIEMVGAWEEEKKQSLGYNSGEFAKHVKEEVRKWIVHPQKMDSKYRELFMKEARDWEQTSAFEENKPKQKQDRMGHGGFDNESGQRSAEANDENNEKKQRWHESEGSDGAEGYHGAEGPEGAGGRGGEMQGSKRKLNIDLLDKGVLRLQALSPLEHQIKESKRYQKDLRSYWSPHPQLKLELGNKKRDLLETRKA